MSSGFVKVSLVGNLGADPEVRHTAAGTAIANLRIACNERVKGKGGEWEEKVEWVNVVCFGKTAESAGQYLTKGRQVYAEGRMQTREWTDKAGAKRFTTEVVAFTVLFLGGDGKKAAAVAATGAEAAPPLGDDDVPF